MNYYYFHIGDYLSHTRHLDLLEDLAYRRLLDIYYLHERPLNGSSTAIAKQVGMREHESVVESVLHEFFETTNDGFRSQRADKEIAQYHAKIAQASKAGKASGAVRKSKRTSAKRQLNGRSSDVEPTNNQEPITNSRERAKRGTRLEKDWQPSEEQMAFCRAERPDLNPKSTADRFRDYWVAQPGQKGVKLDWDATWRNWVRNETAAKGKPTAEPMRRVL